MWILGLSIGLVAFVLGAVLSILAFMDASGLDGMLLRIVLAAVGSAMVCGFLVWGLAFRRQTSEE